MKHISGNLLLIKLKPEGRERVSVSWQWSGSREMFWKRYIHDSLTFIPFSRILRYNSSKNIQCFFRNLKRFQTLPLVWGIDSIVDLGHFVNSHCFQHRNSWRTEQVFRISTKIINETSMKHLMFVCKCQATLKQVWSCSGWIPRAWAYSNLKSRGWF